MTRPLYRSVPCALSFALLAPAQDAPKPTTRPTQGGSPLVVRTSDRGVAERCARGLDAIEGGEVPEAKAGQSWQIALDDGGKGKVSVVAGAAGYMEIVARPGQLLEIFAEQTGEALGIVRGAMVLAFTQQGLKAKDAARMAQAFVDFPKQIATVEVKLSGDPDEVRKQGLDVKIGVVPVAGSDFAALVGSLKPNGQGAPLVPGDGLMSMSLSVDPAEFAKLGKPMLDLAAIFSGKSGEEGKKFAGTMSRAMGWIDGSMALSWAEDGMKIVAGLSDPKSYAELLESEEGKAMMKSGSTQFDVDVQMKVLVHRGVSVNRSTMKPKEDVDLSKNPVFAKGPVHSYMAIAGNWLVMSMLDTKDAGIKALIDRAVDQKLTRAPLPDGAMMTLSADIAKLAEQFAGQSIPDDAPHQMTLAIKRAGPGLGLAIHLK